MKSSIFSTRLGRRKIGGNRTKADSNVNRNKIVQRVNANLTALTALTLFGVTIASSLVQAAGITSQRVASGLARPIFVTAPPGDANRLFVVEQHTGRIKILNLASGVINATPFLDIDGLATGNEQGLLGLAFHPQYDENGLFYVNLTINGSGTTHIRRYQVSADPDIADPDTATTVLTYNQPQSNHNGGWIGFGPEDGLLYIASGDGGSGNDTGSGHTAEIGNAQDITDNLLGKILRIDVNGDDFPGDPARNYAIPITNPFVDSPGDDEIWAYGLRNPWRPSFDRHTGDLYIADVGQGAREEVNFQLALDPGGSNYGWRLREGSIATPSSVGGPAPPGAVEPIHDYPHVGAPLGGFSISGGYVYRGPIAALQGVYFFADYVTEQIWSFRFDGINKSEFANRTTELTPDVGSINSIASFGEDSAGDLYIVDLGGEIFKILPDICAGDFNGDGDVDGSDLATFSRDFGRPNCAADSPCEGDFDDDGDVDGSDLAIFNSEFGRSDCP